MKPTKKKTVKKPAKQPASAKRPNADPVVAAFDAVKKITSKY
jgi:hypothetical protein